MLEIVHASDEYSRDWCALYINDKLVCQDHSITFEIVVEYLIENQISFSKPAIMKYVALDLDGTGDGYPEKFSEVKKYKIYSTQEWK